MKNFQDFFIQLPSGATGTVKTRCPQCTPHNRKPENRNAKDLSVNVTEGVWKCWNCDWKGTLKEYEKKVYIKPLPISLPLSKKAIDWFNNRGIKDTTLKTFGITEKKEWMPQTQAESNCIVFPYIRNNEWVNAKFRDGKKNFKLVKDAELTLFNVDAIFGKKRALITEGEIDAMSAHEAGFFDTCSVPNGASKGTQRLDYLDNCWYAFADCEIIYIATDNDEPGIALKNELARRLGKERCVDVQYPIGCKDLNDVLVGHGTKAVWDCINNSKHFPIDGIYQLIDFENDLDNVFVNGFPPGVKCGYPTFDNHLTISGGQVTVVTGIPNSGKSAFLDQLLINLSSMHRWNIGMCDFENQPMTRHAGSLCSLFIGKSFFNFNNKMSSSEYSLAKDFIQTHFFWFATTSADCTIEGILERAAQLVATKGIKVLKIDPYNYIESNRPMGMTETEYVSKVLGLVCNFAKKYDIHIFFVAHPTKIKKNLQTGVFDVPTLYDISGSANWFNKSDNGITVYRDDKTDLVTVYIQKVKFFFNGKKGFSEFNYNVYNGRYTEVGNENSLPDNPSAGIARMPYKDDKTEDLPF